MYVYWLICLVLSLASGLIIQTEDGPWYASLGVGGLVFVLAYMLIFLKDTNSFIKPLASIWPLGRSPRNFDPTPRDLDELNIDYIQQTRDSSHETELVITVGLLAGLFSIDLLWVEAIIWAKLPAIDPQVTRCIISTIILTVWFLRIGIAIHLLLRATWIGLVGLGFSYPLGVHRISLKGFFIRRMFHHLTPADTAVRLTIEMERICSMIFGILMYCLVSMIAWILLIFLVARIHIKTNSLLVGLLAAALCIIVWNITRISTKISVRKLRIPLIDSFYFLKGTLISQNPLTTFMMITFSPLFVIAGFIIHPDEILDRQNYVYLDEMQLGYEVRSPTLKSSIVEKDILRIIIPDISLLYWDIPYDEWPDSNDGKSQGWNDLLSVTLNSKKATKISWFIAEPDNSKELRGFISLTGLNEGSYNLVIKPKKNENSEQAIEIPFYIDRSN